MNRFILILFILICSTAMTFGGVVHVPADQPTIQEGIITALASDTVLVAEGTYYENINFMGKAITVASYFIFDRNENHINKTIINGSQPDDPNLGSVVTFNSGEDTNSVLCGFTITGGTGTLELFQGMPPIRSGGGIFCTSSGSKVIHNIVKNNKAENGFFSFGGGFYSGPPFVPTIVVLENNVFQENIVIGTDMTGGGGAAFYSSGRIVNNTFEGNIAHSIGGSASGGGLTAQSWDPAVLPPNEVEISKNIVLHNKCTQEENATFWLGGIGGGISILGSKCIITNNIIQHNEVSAANSSFAPGILFDYPPDEVYFRNNIVSHNYFSGPGLCYGGGFAVWDGNPTLENNLFENNKASFGGGGWIGDLYSNAKISNNTIIKNHAELKGGAIYTKSAAPSIRNSILWNNKAPEGSEIFVESGTIDVTYSVVEGGWNGLGNINTNPKLRTNVSLLHKKSPCIDAGNPDIEYNDPENPLFPGFAEYPSQGLVRNDIGAYGGPNTICWNNFLGKMESDEFENSDKQTASLTKQFRLDNYPNPFNPSTTINYSIPNQSIVTLKVFDVLGREVSTLVNKEQPQGNYEVEFDASYLTSGIYFYRLQASEFTKTKKMILLR